MFKTQFRDIGGAEGPPGDDFAFRGHVVSFLRLRLRDLTDHVHPTGVFIVPLRAWPNQKLETTLTRKELDQVVLYLFSGYNDAQ
ncbi:hypothetical protein [Halobacillus sp. B29]|uniref:hypothetical protein n=1 Tax=Halobacillus sp. B29 TaxID=3457432 RepID=UPI003FCD8B54